MLHTVIHSLVQITVTQNHISTVKKNDLIHEWMEFVASPYMEESAKMYYPSRYETRLHKTLDELVSLRGSHFSFWLVGLLFLFFIFIYSILSIRILQNYKWTLIIGIKHKKIMFIMLLVVHLFPSKLKSSFWEFFRKNERQKEYNRLWYYVVIIREMTTTYRHSNRLIYLRNFLFFMSNLIEQL